MLNVLRENFKTQPWLKLVLALVGLGLVAYLGNYFFGDGSAAAGGDWVVRVGEREVSEDEFKRAVKNRMDDLPNPALKDQLRPAVVNEVLNGYVARQVMLQDAKRVGLAVSGRQVRDRIRSYPGLQSPSGEFIGSGEYKRILTANRYPGGPAGFERAIRDDIMVEAWRNLVAAPVTVSDEEVLDLYKQVNDRTSVNYVMVSTAAYNTDAEVDDRTQRDWYDEHIDGYARPEGRNIRYVVVSREDQRASLAIGDELIREAYEAQKASYRRGEQRQASHILFRVEPDETEEGKAIVRGQAEEVLRRLQEGEDFATLATELSQDPGSAAKGGDLGFFSRQDMVQEFSDAAFAGEVGQLAPDVVETIYGFHVIKVTDSQEAGHIPFEEVEPSLRRALEFQELQRLSQEEADRLRQGVADAEQFGEMAERLDLVVESAVFYPDQRIVELGASPDFTQAVAALEAGTVSQPLRVNEGLALVAVDDVIPAGPAPFEDVQDKVLAALREDRARTAAIDAARKAWEGGKSVEAAAKTLDQDMQEFADLRPGQPLPGMGAPAPELSRALFGDGAQAGDSGMLELSSGAVIYEITARIGFDATQFETEKSRLRTDLMSQKKNYYIASVLGPMIDAETVERNDDAVRRLTAGR